MDVPSDPVAPPSGVVRRGLTVMWAEVRLHPRPFTYAVIGSLTYALATVLSSVVISRVVDQVITPRFQDGNVRTGAVLAGALAIFAVGVLKSAGIVFRRVNATITQARVQETLRSRVVDQFIRLPLDYHRSKPTGELLAHGCLPEPARLVANTILDQLIQEVFQGPQRVRFRDVLYELGWERP